jgi:hypothetical protein
MGMKNVNCGCCDGVSENCLCEEAWDLTAWSLSVFGKSFSGGWIPSTVVPSDCFRSGSDCDYDDPAMVVDTLEDGGWVDLPIPNLSALCLCTVCGGHGGQKVYHWRRSSAYSSRVGVWHHIQTYTSINAASCGTNGVKFVVNVIYSVTRIVQATDRISNRFQRWERDCDAGTQSAIGDIIYLCGDVDDYIITEVVLPCTWPQLDSGGLCATDSNVTDPTCAPATPAFVDRDVISLQCVSGTCTSITTATQFTCAAGNLDGGCACQQPFQSCTFGVPVNPDFTRAQRRQYSVTWESECYDCGSIPSVVDLERTACTPTIAFTGDVTVNVFNSATGSGCGTAPAVSITIPFALTANVS